MDFSSREVYVFLSWDHITATTATTAGKRDDVVGVVAS